MGVAVAPTATGVISGVIITGNVGSAGTTLIYLANADNVQVANNVTVGGTYLQYSGSSNTNISMDGLSFTTAGRPAATTQKAGSWYYDTTLSKPAWSNGTNWKDAAGTNV
jgi:hypothetical protein